MGLDRNIDITPQQRKTILSLLETFLPNTTSWVYGSRVKWTSKPNSDLDMVVFSTSKQVGKVSLLQEAFDESDLPFCIDLHVWGDVPDQFQKNIEADHVELGKENTSIGEADWEYCKLGDVARIQGGFAFKSKDFSDYGVPVVKIKNIRKRDIDLSDAARVSEEIAEKCTNFYVRRGDVLISMTGSGIQAPSSIVGRVARHSDDDKKFLINQRVGRFVVTELDKVDLRYIYYYFSQETIQYLLVSIATGSANQVNISGKQIESIDIPLPPLRKQKSIAHILGSLDDKIELNRQINATLEAMAQTLFKSWFVDFDPVIDNALAAGNEIPEALQLKAAARQALINQRGNDKLLPDDIRQQFPSAFEFSETMGWIPEGWEVEKLNKLLEVKYGKDHKKLKEGNIPVYGSGGLMRFADSSLYEGESILIPRKGTLSNLMYVDEEFWTVDTMFFSIPKLQNSAKYLFYCLMSFDFVSMNVGSAVPSMTTKVLNDLNVLKPSETLLKVFDKYLIDLFKQKKYRNEETQKLTKLRDTLLPKLLSGELRIPDAEKLVKEVL